jgi:hypothetical protein
MVFKFLRQLFFSKETKLEEAVPSEITSPYAGVPIDTMITIDTDLALHCKNALTNGNYELIETGPNGKKWFLVPLESNLYYVCGEISQSAVGTSLILTSASTVGSKEEALEWVKQEKQYS